MNFKRDYKNLRKSSLFFLTNKKGKTMKMNQSEK